MISIIVPIYNCEKYLDRCIKSILFQTYKNIEVILIDDGSTDNSIKICEHYLEIDERVRFFTKRNSGVSATRNLGIEKATGTYIQFIDADDYVETNYCESFNRIMENNICDLVICSFNNVYKQNNSDDYINPVKIPFNKMISTEEFIKEIHLLEKFTPFIGACWNKIYSLDMLRKYNIKFDEKINLHEDSIFVFDMYRNSKLIYIINEPLYNYYHAINNFSLTTKTHVDLYYYFNCYFEKYKNLVKDFNGYAINQTYLESICYDAFLGCMINIFYLKSSRKNKMSAIREIVNNCIFRESLLYGRKEKLVYHILNVAIVKKKIWLVYLIIKFIYLKHNR